MAHFSQLDDNNYVMQTIVVSNDDIRDENGVEQEALGIAFCQNLFGGRWIQTSYNGKFRKQYAEPGYYYDSQRDAFISPTPYPSWVLNEETCKWQPPVPYPEDGGYYVWNEGEKNWNPKPF